MDYSVRPSRSELEKVKSIIEDCVNRYEYALDIDDIEFLLSWQRFDGDFSVLEVKEDELMIAVNPEVEDYDIGGLLRALFEAEFIHKAEYPEIEFKWQEASKFAYSALKMKEVEGEELKLSEDIVARWPSIQEQLKDKVGDYNEFFYMNTGLIGEALATKLEENYDARELPGLKKSDVMDSGEKFFE
ncbi:MAG: hypothetical protein V5A72_02250 [Candidatus Nanohaloarchaea archaeon]